MANMDGREALRGAEIQMFDLLAVVLTSKQWAELLKAPLERAVAAGKRALAQKMLRAGAERGDSLHKAAQGGHGEIVHNLVENGASVHARDTGGSTPLHHAADRGETKVVQLLLLKGAYKDATDNREYTPLYLAALGGHVAAALALLAAGADVNLQFGDRKGSVVQVAAEKGLVEVMRAAIECGADVNVITTVRSTPLHHAAVFNKVEAIDLLVEAGANLEARDCTGSTPLHDAADPASLGAVSALLRHGADVNTQNYNLQTPLDWAAATAGMSGAAEVVESPLRSGADETILNDGGEAAADVVGEATVVAEGEYPLPEDVHRVRQLLANAPADRIWRRRGYLVLCRAHLDRMRQIDWTSSACAGVARRIRSRANLGRTEIGSCTGTAGGNSIVGGWAGGDWAVVVARLLVLQEEDIFRSIVGYL